MSSPNGACSVPTCAAGSYCPHDAYYVDKPEEKLHMASPVFGCPASAGTGMDLYAIMCQDQPSLKRSVAGRLSVEDED